MKVGESATFSEDEKTLDCRDTIILQQAAVIEQMRDRFRHISEYWNRDNNERAMEDACWRVIEIAEEAISIQPCLEVLNTVRVDAIHEVAKLLEKNGYDQHTVTFIEWMSQHIKKVEV